MPNCEPNTSEYLNSLSPAELRMLSREKLAESIRLAGEAKAASDLAERAARLAKWKEEHGE